MSDQPDLPGAAAAPGPHVEFYKPPFIPVVIGSPSHPRAVEFLIGYWGDAPEHGYQRLYFDPFLQDYIDVPQVAVLASTRMPLDRSPLGGSYVWIEAHAQVFTGRMGDARLLGTLRQGLHWLATRAGAANAGVGAGAAAARNAVLAGNPALAQVLSLDALGDRIAQLETLAVPPPPPPPPPDSTVTESRSGVTTRNPYC